MNVRSLLKLFYVFAFRYIAMVTKQKAFNKSLVDENTQVIFMDEAHVGLLEPDDWKILTQGGLTAHDRKYKKSTPAVIRCPMFITCQTEMDFGVEHNAAMDARLRKFHFKSLSSPPLAGVQEALRENAMDCIVWACSVASTPEDKLPAPTPGSVARPGDFNEEVKNRIMTMNLDDSESDKELSEEEQLMAEEDRMEEEEDESDSLKLNFKREDAPGLARLVLAERKSRAIDMKWLSTHQAQRVTSVWVPLPFPCDGNDSDEEDMFITQSSQASTSRPPSQNIHRRNSKKRPARPSSQVSKRGQITHFFQPTQE